MAGSDQVMFGSSRSEQASPTAASGLCLFGNGGVWRVPVGWGTGRQAVSPWPVASVTSTPGSSP